MSECEALPAGLPEKGTLYVAPPLAHTRGTLRRLLWGSDLRFGDPSEGVLAVEVCPDGLGRLCELLLGGLSEAELRDSQAVLVEEGADFGIEMLPRMRDLLTFACGVKEGWLQDILREERVTVHFQPIVSVAEPGEIFAYECLLRGVGRDGELVSPGPMFEVARRAGLLFDLDRTARLKAIEGACSYGISARVFINFDPSSIYHPKYCLRSTLEAVERSGLSPEKIVFEVTESDEVKDGGHLRGILDHYREGGFGVALDDLGSGYCSLNLLASLRPDFVKLDIGLAQGLGRDPYRAAISRKLIELADELGVAVIVEGIETEEQWRWLSAHGAEYAQGYYFAKPASPPPIPAQVYA
jgi:EAL domain-containing protein (putative c-di-GMP-specific phosphodiesterase class I)